VATFKIHSFRANLNSLCNFSRCQPSSLWEEIWGVRHIVLWNSLYIIFYSGNNLYSDLYVENLLHVLWPLFISFRTLFLQYTTGDSVDLNHKEFEQSDDDGVSQMVNEGWPCHDPGQGEVLPCQGAKVGTVSCISEEDLKTQEGIRSFRRGRVLIRCRADAPC
jgi:hypothetical protein